MIKLLYTINKVALLFLLLLYSVSYSQNSSKTIDTIAVILSKKYSKNENKDKTPSFKLFFTKSGVLIKKEIYEGFLKDARWICNKLPSEKIYYTYSEKKLKEKRTYLVDVSGNIKGEALEVKTLYSYDKNDRLLKEARYISKSGIPWYEDNKKDSLHYEIKYEYDLASNVKEIGEFYSSIKKLDSLKRVISYKHISNNGKVTLIWKYEYTENQEIGYLDNFRSDREFSLVKTTTYNSDKSINEVNYKYDIKETNKRKIIQLKNKKISFYKNGMNRKVKFYDSSISDRKLKPSYVIDIYYPEKYKIDKTISQKINKEINNLILNY